MKKVRIACVVLFLFVFILAAGCGEKGKGEDLYFAMPQPLANTAEGWTKVPWEVYRYTGGETFSLAYTLPDTEDYVLCLSGSALYYAPQWGGPVTCVDLKSGGAKTLGELPTGGISCLTAEGDRAFAAVRADRKFILYEVSAQNTRMICEDVVVMAELALGDGGLFYIDNAQEMALMRYDLKTGETRKIADKVGIGDLEYDGGYVYSGNVDTYGYNVKTGEKVFIASENGYRMRDGWLYYADYADDSADRDPGWKKFMRRNLKNGKTESLGTAYVPYLEDLTFRHAVDFGKKGFIAYLTYFKEDTKYMYFPYGASQGTELRLENSSVSAPQGTAPQEDAAQGSEIQAATVVFFTKPMNFLAQNGAIEDQTHIVFRRNRAACAEVIDTLAGILQGIDSWSADTAGREELYVDGGFSLSDAERLYWFSYTDNTVFYTVQSMDSETGKVNVEFYFAALSEADMEYIRSLKDSKDGYRY